MIVPSKVPASCLHSHLMEKNTHILSVGLLFVFKGLAFTMGEVVIGFYHERKE